MSLRDFNWSQKEKKIAKAAYDKAYQKEMNEIKNELKKRIDDLDDLKQIWSIHDYLTERRDEIDEKYDYRYSVLILVFIKLISEGYIEEKDLEGLSEDKLEAIGILSK